MLGRIARGPPLAAVKSRCFAAAFTSQAQQVAETTSQQVHALGDITGAATTTAAQDPWWIVDVAQTVIETVHTTTGLPWWATFGLTAVAVRGTLFPLMVYQIKATERMTEASKETRNVWKAYLYARLFLPPGIPQQQIEALKLLRKGAKLTWEKHDTHPVKCVATPLIQIPSFILMAYSTREIVRSGRFEGLDTGGFWLFQNLVEADGTFILPAIAVGCTYLNFEMMNSKLPIMQFLKNKLQYIPLLSFPFICQLPQGVFFYWIASSWCSFAQSAALRQPAIRSALGLKTIPDAASKVDLKAASSAVNSILPAAPAPTARRGAM